MIVLQKLKHLLAAIIKIDPQKPLHHHFAFWLPIFIAGGFSLYAGLSTTTFGLEHLAYPKRTMDALAYPIFILSFALPVVLAIGRFHASAQRAETIRISNSTMSFKHYFDHREAFLEYSKQHEASSQYMNIRLAKPFLLYEIYFPNSQMNRFDLTPSDKTFERIDNILKLITKRIMDIQKPMHIVRLQTVNNVFEPFGVVLNINIEKLESGYPRGISKDAEPMALMIRTLLELLDHLSEFDRENQEFAQLISKKLKDELVIFSGNTDVNIRIRNCLNKLILKNNPLFTKPETFPK